MCGKNRFTKSNEANIVKLMKKHYLALFLLAISLFASGFVLGGTNLGFGGYPDFDKIKPYAPFSLTEYEWDRYTDEVRDYRSEAQEYIENARNDIQRISEAMEEAERNANEVVDEYNRKARW